MAKDPPRYTPRPVETAEMLERELRRRGMSDEEIRQATRKRKRRGPLEMAARSNHLIADYQRLAEKIGTTDEICTVDEAAARLKLHPKTVLRFIKEGRLPGRRIGKSYRIRKADIDSLAGAAPSIEPAGQEARITSIVELPAVSVEMAQKWSRTVTNALNAKPAGSPFRADVIYEPDREHLKIIVVGPTAEVVNLLNLVRVWQEQLAD